jgi:catechol 2,3-dioxygenase-like lactoylglutathione lyase family enzyme
MIYTADLARARAFYERALGFKLLDEYPGAYARLKSPAGRTTIALHLLERGQQMDTRAEGLRLYLEVEELEAFCATLAARGITIDEGPALQPWGWKHAYLRDPDGHQLSLYWAGRKRFQPTRIGGGRRTRS